MTTADQIPSLHAEGVAEDVIGRLAAAAGFRTAAPGAPLGARDVLLFANFERSQLVDALARGFAGYVEVTPGDAVPPMRLQTASGAGLMLSLSTQTAWSIDSAAVFCDALEARRALASDRRPDVELALHEAIANAIIHGNLSLGSSFGTDAAAFDEFCRRLTERMQQPSMGNRRVDIRAVHRETGLEIRVMDEGEGFDVSSLDRSARDLDAKSGRGLEIIRAMSTRMSIDDGGRTLSMSFEP